MECALVDLTFLSRMWCTVFPPIVVGIVGQKFVCLAHRSNVGTILLCRLTLRFANFMQMKAKDPFQPAQSNQCNT